MKFKLGEKAKDIVTGFSGVIMSRIEYFTGCDQYGLCPTKMGKDGKIQDWLYFDESRLKKIAGKIVLANATKKTRETGADGPLPPGRN